MKYDHNEKYNELQTEYLKTRDSKILGKMYEIAKEIAGNYIKKYCYKKGIRLNIEELSHDSALFVIEQYLRKPNFMIGKLSSYIYFGVIKCMFNNSGIEQKEVSYEQYFNERYKDN
jgi:hypothetical protein